MNYVLVAILGPFAVALGTVIQIHVTGRQRRLEKEQDWRRQDELHARDEAVRLADKAEVNGQLKVIHGLVNSNMTAALKSEYDSTLRELVLMRELGRPDAAIELVEAKLAEQRAVLDDRMRQHAEAETQANKEGT